MYDYLPRVIAACLTLTSLAHSQPCQEWVRKYPAHVPGSADGQAMAYDAARRQTILADGNPNLEIHETWSWNGGDWSLLASGELPESNRWHSMAFDSQDERAILFGGVYISHGDVIYTDSTWQWDGQEWSAFLGPSGRALTAMAYDSQRGVVVLFGGSDGDGNVLGDTWELAGQTWKKRIVPGPSARSDHCMAYDSARGVTVLHGGSSGATQTWEWDGEAWAQRASNGPISTGSAMIYDSARQVCVLVGGGFDQRGQQLWEWDGENWTERHPSPKPPPIYRTPIAYDSVRGAIVLLVNNQTWEYVCPAPPCYPDLDGNGVLDLFDFLAFVNSFNAGDAGPADCDHNQSLDLFDFLCYTNAFNKGC